MNDKKNNLSAISIINDLFTRFGFDKYFSNWIKTGNRQILRELRNQIREAFAAHKGPMYTMESVHDFFIKNSLEYDIPTRLYIPRHLNKTKERPVIFFCHGGGWVIGGMKYAEHIARRLAFVTGLPVLSFDYRLAPETKHAISREDARTVFDWCMANKTFQDVSLETLIPIGIGAGTHVLLELMEYAQQKHPQIQSIQGLVFALPFIDMTLSNYDDSLAYKDPFFPKELVNFFIKSYLTAGEHPEDFDVNAMNHEGMGNFPPTLIITSELDPLWRDGLILCEKLKQQHVPTTYHMIKNGIRMVFDLGGSLEETLEAFHIIKTFVEKLIISIDERNKKEVQNI